MESFSLINADDPLPNILLVYGMPEWLCWLIIAILLIVSGIFSASENAFSNCNKYHFKLLAEEGKLTPKIILRLTTKFEDTLVSILVSNNIVQTLMSTISALLFYNLCLDWGMADSSAAAVISTVVMACLVYVISDTIPKILSKEMPNRMAYILAWPDFIASIILYPIILIFRLVLKLVHKLFKIKDSNILSKEDFVLAADEAINDENITNPDEKLLEPNELEMFEKALVFDSIDIKSIYKSIEKISYITTDDLSINRLNEIIFTKPYSRYPVLNAETKEFIGILSINVLFKEYAKDPHLDIRSILLEPIYCYIDDKVDDIFEELNKSRLHFALVKDKNDIVIGMVTMDDILNELLVNNPKLNKNKEVNN